MNQVFKNLKISVGTKSILFGVHQFLIHPLFVLYGWWKIYGFPKDIRLWISFFVHDLGYWGKQNMDGLEGEKHVELGAKIMEILFGKQWGDFCLYHSRFKAKQDKTSYSQLCIADKLSICLTPWWLYLPLAKLSGELSEYMKESDKKYASMKCSSSSPRQWYQNIQTWLLNWVNEHKNGEIDTQTPEND